MKILVYLEKAAVRGGIEVFAERHVAALRAEGHEVEISHSPFPVPPSSFPDEIIIHKCSDVATLEKFLPEKTTLYVHDHEPVCPRGYAYTPLGKNCTSPGGVWPCIFCAPLCRSWRTALGRVFSQRRRIAAMARLKKIVVISQFMKSRLVANGIPPEKIEVKPPVIEIGMTSETGNCRPASPESLRAIDLLYVGQLIRGKGVQLLLRAMAKLRSPRTLDIVGTGNMEPKLKALAARLGLAGRVKFNGFQTNPLDWMRRAKCVVVPSFWQEPYGLVAAEAVALGRPVVAFAVGGLPEACGGKATLVPAGDVAALAAALEPREDDPGKEPPR
jgi:glycosyltransferase involved in cell wall biosynthesis